MCDKKKTESVPAGHRYDNDSPAPEIGDLEYGVRGRGQLRRYTHLSSLFLLHRLVQPPAKFPDFETVLRLLSVKAAAVWVAKKRDNLVLGHSPAELPRGRKVLVPTA